MDDKQKAAAAKKARKEARRAIRRTLADEVCLVFVFHML